MDLIIVGAGGMGREVFSWLSQEIKGKKNHIIKGFLDDNPQALGKLSYPVKVISGIEDYQPSSSESLVVAILDPTTKKRIVESLVHKGSNFYTLIHPSAIIGRNVSVGKGCVICPGCILTCDITLGDFVFINACSTIGHDTIIKDYTSVNGKVEITGNVNVGKECFFGVGAKVIPERLIGDGSRVGAGSIVIKNVPPGSTVFGNPAKSIWSSCSEEKVDPE